MNRLTRALCASAGLILPLLVRAADPVPADSAETPLQALPYSPGLDLDSLDRQADPCEDFYRFSCGGWISRHPLPADQSSWDVYAKLYDDNERFLWGILADLSAAPAAPDKRSVPQQEIGDYFAACMDEAAIEKADLAPLQSRLDAVAGLKDAQALAPLLAQLHLDGTPALFNFTSSQDYSNSQSIIAFVTADGIGLPDRDYYTRKDAKSVKLRKQYRQHIEHMLALMGDSADQASAGADQVMAIETALAKSALTRVKKRDPHALAHKATLQDLVAAAPHFDWKAYFATLGIAEPGSFNVTEPRFLKAVDVQLASDPLPALKAYLRWHLAHAAAPFLSKRFVNENFNFYGHILNGQPSLRPRWKRCVSSVDQQLGEALGQEYVARVFTPELKARTLAMTQAIEKAMQDDLQHLDWMSPETRRQALDKLHGVLNKIGYPDHWRDYSSIRIRRDDFFGDVTGANRFELHRVLARIGKPLDRGEWDMTPPTVNAYYDPQMNDINFPAGILQPPLFDGKMDDAPNYGNTGGTIGHELTHAFDDEGRQFDGQGNLRDWWTPADARHFKQRAQCIVDQYAKYPVIDELHINSKLTEGEDIADLGGLILAYIAWKAETAGQDLKPMDGFTPDQRFFIGYAQWACETMRPESLREHALIDPHSPARYRVNGVVANMPEFGKAFSCKAGSPMVNPKPCRVW